MSTMGMVTLRSKGKVVMKVVAGCNGNLVREVANQLRAVWPVDANRAYDFMEEIGFGCDDCLVVITALEIAYRGGDEPLSPLYRETFEQPEFNPRWDAGLSEFLEVVDF